MSKKQTSQSIDHTYDGYQFPDSFYESLSRFYFEMDINGQKFVENFIDSYIKYANAETNRVSDVIVNTGFTKSIIDKSLKGIKKNRQFVIKSFFGEMIEEIKKICSRSKDGTMKIKGTSSSFTSIFYRLEPSTKQLTSQSFLDYMIKRGIIERVDESTIKFVSSVPKNHINTKDKMLRLFANVVDHFMGTLVRNHHAQTPSETNFQQTYRSWHVEPEKHDDLRNDLTTLLRKQWQDVQDLIDNYEVKTEFEKKRLEETGAEIGVSSFVYDIPGNQNK